MENIIGREEEKAVLEKLLRSGEPELVAVYGRRRVGKTFLIHNTFRQELAFEFSGIHQASLEQQLENFSEALAKAMGSPPLIRPASWIRAFAMLTDYLTPAIRKERKVVFFDEFPWINTARSGFLPAFENFWNSWASRQNNLVVIICGSAATWMIQKVINNRGGLHNRVTRRIRLLPFTLTETEAFLKGRKVNLNRYQVLQLYMAMGGIPQYLKEIERGESAIQTIDRLCFTKDGLLHDEFKSLYHSLFDEATDHMEVVRELAKKASGLTRGEIMVACKLTSGGGVSQLLEELAESGFITPYIPFGKTRKNAVYKLTDEYSLFYIRFIENRREEGMGTWIRLSTGSSWKSWSGYAFESICQKHFPLLKKALRIEGVYTEASVWRSKAGKGIRGAQIDLLIDRQDQCINICEMKFSVNAFEITRSYAEELQNKLNVFRDMTKTRKTLFLTMVTTYGVKNSDSYTGLIQQEITMDALFE
jgi:hypothetical protein